ncbi:MAG: hypothetical protein RJQ07_04455 [Pseudomonadales bacterium]
MTAALAAVVAMRSPQVRVNAVVRRLDKMVQSLSIQSDDPNRLAKSILHKYVELGCRVSLEGNLDSFDLSSFEGLTDQETHEIHRHTIRPKLDFLVFDINPDSLSALLEVLEDPFAFEPDKIIHFQIERAGSLLFGAYDNFDDECVFAFPPISEEDLQNFKKEKIIKSYNQVTGS